MSRTNYSKFLFSISRGIGLHIIILYTWRKYIIPSMLIAPGQFVVRYSEIYIARILFFVVGVKMA